MQGKVVWFDSKKGYGFVQGEDSKDYFVHYKHIVGDSYKNLVKDELVNFKALNSEKGLIAKEVEKNRS